jgi:hypothetical protein
VTKWLTSQSKSRWTVIKHLDIKYVLARCSCGTEKRVFFNNILIGASRSCGCLRAEEVSARRLKHGRTKSVEYRIWRHMKDRCYNENDINYQNYGARGIIVCAEWIDSFEKFYRAMGPCPRGMSIDRINVDGNYEPGNCRWADRLTQMNNTTNNVLMEYNGRTQTIAQWAREVGLKYATLYRRVAIKGEAPEIALRTIG